MLRAAFVIFLMLLFYKSSWAQINEKYAIISPGTIRPNSDFSVIASVPNVRYECHIELSIQSSNSKVISTVAEIDPMTTKITRFKIPNISSDNYTLTAKGIRGIFFSNSTALNYAADMLAVYVQTDKATYKPGDLVQFRVLFLDENLFPRRINKTNAIYIKNPDNGLEQQFLNVTPKNGVHSGKLQLSNFTIFGKWSIDVMINTKLIQTKTFNVDEYVLPKFEVIINAPQMVSISESKLRFTVYSRYTFGKFVKGKAYITIKSPRVEPEEISVILKDNTNVEFSMEDVAPGYVHNSYKLDVLVSVEEDLTGVRQNASTEIFLVRKQFTMTPQKLLVDCTNKWETFNYSISIRDLNNEPVRDKKTPVTYKHLRNDDVDDDDDDRNYKTWTSFLNKSGIATISLDCDTYQTSKFRITYKNETFKAQITKKQKNQDLKAGIHVLTSNSKMNQSIEIQLNTEDFTNYFISLIVARGKIILTQIHYLPVGSRSKRFLVMPTHEMIPNAKIYIHYIYNNEFKFFESSFNIQSQSHTANAILIEAPEETTPGDDITLKISTSKYSYVGIMAVDQSVLLLKSGNDFNHDNIFKKLEEFKSETPEQYLGTSTKYPGAEAGLITMTNAHYPHEKISEDDVLVPYSFGNKRNKPEIRKNFLETWFFDDIISTGGNYTYIIKKKVPDTITSWIITGFSLNQELGFALTEKPIKIRAFKKLFISTNLPYSVKKEELVSIPVILFNYLSRKVQTRITLDYNADEFQLINATNCIQEGKCTKIVYVEPNNGKTIYFIIRPKIIGSITLNFKATYVGGNDAIQKQLKVESEGVTVYKNYDNYLNAEEPYFYEFFIDLPEGGIVDGSEYTEISVVGDIMGSALSNLEDLVHMPAGLGEPNMIKFVPNVLLLNYLKSTRQLRPEIEKRIKDHLQNAYQYQLTFRHDDGSYGVFSKSGRNGSTWLTAYVAHSISQASKRKYIVIESKTLRDSLNFLITKQAPNGSFREDGKVIFNSHENTVGLTAFVLLAFLETSKFWQDHHQNTIINGLQYLENNIETTDDLYALSIAAYALQLRKLPAADSIMRYLARIAKTDTDKGHTWWSKNSVTEEGGSPKSQDVECTAYILMTLMDMNTTADHLLPIVQWLISRRNSNGGFASTHETVVALQALVKYAEKYRGSEVNMEIEVILPNGITNFIRITKENAMELQRIEIPKNTRKFMLKVNGLGAVVVQRSYRYNVLKKESQPSFVLTTDLKPDNTISKRFDLEVCATYEPDDSGEAPNLVIMKIDIPSGLSAISESLVDITDEIDSVKSIDITNDKTNIIVYFDNFEPHQNKCITSQIERSFTVAQQKPVAININDYYDVQRQATHFYNINSSPCDICETDDENYNDCKISCQTNFNETLIN